MGTPVVSYAPRPMFGRMISLRIIKRFCRKSGRMSGKLLRRKGKERKGRNDGVSGLIYIHLTTEG